MGSALFSLNHDFMSAVDVQSGFGGLGAQTRVAQMDETRDICHAADGVGAGFIAIRVITFLIIIIILVLAVTKLRKIN